MSSESDTHYKVLAKRIVKAARKRKGSDGKAMPYKKLAVRLEEDGSPVAYQTLINRINEGAFSFAFALQLLSLMGVRRLEIPPPRQAVIPQSELDTLDEVQGSTDEFGPRL